METLRLRRVQDINLENKKILMRVDYNVPIKEGKVSDDTRILETLPTLQHLLKAKAKIILISHLGRPKGKDDKKCSLKPVVQILEKLLQQPIRFLPDCIGQEVSQAAQSLKPGEVTLLENLRFYPQEEDNNDEFAKNLAKLGEFFVQEAFGTLHRAHASTAGIPKYLPSAIGFLIQKELQFLDRALNAPERPFLAIVGGAKVSDKIGVLLKLVEKTDVLIIGGGMAYTFLAAQGISIGNSILEKDKTDQAQEIIEKAYAKGVQCLLPADHLIAQKADAQSPTKIAESMAIPEGWMGVDIGPHSMDLFRDEIKAAKTIFWNGPLGIFEIPPFDQGTIQIAKAMEEATQNGAITVVGGGDSLAALKAAGVAEKGITHRSTGGGASLELIEGKNLPGLAALTQQKN